MRRRPVFRLWSALLGLWFVVAGQEPPFAHPCFMVPVGAAAAQEPGHASHHASPSSHHDEHAGDAGHTPAPTDGPAPECECIGDCGALAPMPQIPLARLAEVAPPELRVVPAPLVAHVARIPGAPPRVQPFANGPPPMRHA
jgi:hypothetical protein